MRLVCDAGFRRTLGIGRNGARLVAAAATLATIPLGIELDAKAQIGALATAGRGRAGGGLTPS